MYYADWMRATAVYLVIFIHCLNSAADATNLQDRDAREKKDGICKSMAQVGIPLFFYISGMSSTFFDTAKNSYFKYVWTKINRLMVPLVLSVIFLLIPRLYMS